MKSIYNFLILAIGLTLVACDPTVEDKTSLGPVPNPSFDILQGEDANNFILKNTTSGAFLTNWVVEGGSELDGEEVSVDLPFMGEYAVTMTTFNQGGSASLTKTITVEQDDASGCVGNMELLTDCGTKTWRLAQEENALHVGPSLFETWWGNSTGDLSDRACHFNDEYIFSSDGVYEYDNVGDFFADSDPDGNVTPAELGLAVGCHPSSAWPDDFKVWDSNIHSFTITDNQLTVIGEGAWMGLYKVGSNSEVTTPQSSVAFSIESLTEDRMVIYTDYGGLVWRFTFTAD